MNRLAVIHIYIFLWVVAFSTPVLSQTPLDSLKQELQNHKEKDTVRVNLLNAIAQTYCSIDIEKAIVFIRESEEILNTMSYTKGKAKTKYINGLISETRLDYDEALKYYKNALELYKGINFHEGISDCLISLGDVNHQQSNHKEAIRYLNEAIKFNETIGYKKGVAKAFNNIGIVYMALGNYKEAITYFNKALKINTEINYKHGIANCTNNLAMIYYREGNYSLSLEYFQKSLSINEDFGEALKISVSLMNIGALYYELQNYNKAIEFNERALKIAIDNDSKKDIATINSNLGLFYHKEKQYQKSINFLKNAIRLCKEIDFKMQLGFCLNNIGDVYLTLKNYSEALTYFKEAIEINAKTSNQLGLTHSYLGIAKVYTFGKQCDTALVYALKCKELSVDLNLLDYEKNIEELLSEIYENKGNYKRAFESQQKFKLLNDSIFNKKNVEKIARIESEFKFRQAIDSANIRELKLTKEVSTVNISLQKSQRNIFLIIITLLLTALILGGVIFSLKWRNIKEKNQNILVEQKLLRSQMTPHFIFNSLSVLQGMILNKEKDKSITYLSKFSKLLRIVLENSRDKIVPLIQELDAIDNYMVLQNLDADPPYEYGLFVEENININLFQIPPMLIQPFIENAIEHAFSVEKESREITIHLKFIDQKLICTIADNGIGIDALSLKTNVKKKSLATTITKERLQIMAKDFKIHGSITIEDRKKYNEHGTLVTLVIPYKINEN